MPMLSLPVPSHTRATLAESRVRPRPTALICLGLGVGTLVAFGLYFTKTVYVAVLPLGLLVLVPALLINNFRVYWFAVFLLSLQLPISKSLNNGLAVFDRLKIDYTIWNFTFEVTATDLVLLVL